MKMVKLQLCVYVSMLSLLLFSCAVRRAEPLTGKSFNPANNRVVNGEKVFMASCHKCHPSGEGGLGPSLLGNPAPQFIKRFQMRHGLGVMPSFKENEISKSDLHDISKYLRAWKKY